jgi:integrase
MGRHGEPWKRKGRGWFIAINGRQVKLAPEWATKGEARKSLEAIRTGGGPSDGMTTREAVGRFLEAQEGRLGRGEITAGRLADLNWFLASFLAVADRVPLADLRKHHLVGWLDRNARWGPATRKMAVTIVRAAYRWARDMGHVDCPDHLLMGKMARAPKRDAFLSDEEVAAIRAIRDDPEWHNLIDFLAQTGCRPKEVCTLDAAYVDFDEGIAWVVDKIRRKTGSERRPVYLTDRTKAILAEQVAKHPDGAVFRNRRGTPWKPTTLLTMIAKSGAPGFPYALRHTYITKAVEAVGLAKASKLAGHTRLEQTLSYTHAPKTNEELKRAANEVSRLLVDAVPAPGSSPARGRDIPSPGGDTPGPSSAPPDGDPDRPARRPRRK